MIALAKQKTSWPNRPRRSSASLSAGSRYVIRITRNWLLVITVISAYLVVCACSLICLQILWTVGGDAARHLPP